MCKKLPDEIPVPVGHVLVGHTGGHVEHDNGALALDKDVKIPDQVEIT